MGNDCGASLQTVPLTSSEALALPLCTVINVIHLQVHQINICYRHRNHLRQEGYVLPASVSLSVRPQCHV